MVQVAQRAKANRRDTASRILDVAERLVQRRGFNGFSYADVAAELGVTKPSLHYHYAGKAELGEALIDRYTTRFLAALEAIDATGADARAKLDAYAGLYGNVLQSKRMCLCGMLAAEYQTLPRRMRQAVVLFFDENESWLARVLEEGRRDRELRFSGSAHDEARMLICGLEGAMLVARPYGDADRFQAAANHLLASI